MAQSLSQALARELQKFPNLDPRAVFAIAQHEGLSGGVGDNGTSFGPFQLHQGGALPSGIPLSSANQWAWSPQGLDYALSRIGSVAGGLKGLPAIEAISTRFERPANPQAEIADAARHYGVSAPQMSVPSQMTGPASNSRLVQALTNTFRIVGLPTTTLQAALGPGGGAKIGGKAGQGQSGLPGPPLKGNGLGGFKAVDGVPVDSRIAPEVAALVSRFGVTPTSGLRSAAHNAQVGGAQNSDHLRGDAVDFAGTPQEMSALYQWAQGRFPYVEPMAQAKNHVHISFRRPSA